MATLKPNSSYYKIKVRVSAREHIYITYPGFADFYELEEDLEVPEFYMSEDQYFKRYDRTLEDHLKAALRRYVENITLGHEHAEVDAEGNINEETWEWIPGHIDPKDFHMLTLPMMKVVREEYQTDALGNLHKIEA